MNWHAAFLGQAENCAVLGSPFTARLLRLLAERGLPEGTVRERIATWPDQSERLSRTGAALDLAARAAPAVLCMDAAEFLAARLSDPQEGKLHMVFHTIAWQYFPPGTQARGLDLLAAAAAGATRNRPLARIAMEADGDPSGAALTATLWPGGQTHRLGRADFHGRWIDWTAPPPEDVRW